MIAKLEAYWKSKKSNIHALIALLSGAAGITALEMMHVPETWAKAVAGGCMLLGALLFTPGEQ